MTTRLASFMALGLLLSSAAASADARSPLRWSEIRADLELALTQPIEIPVDAGGGQVTFAAGAPFALLEMGPVETVPVTEFVLQAADCPRPEAVGDEMILVTPEAAPAGRDRSVGVLLEPGCVLKLYVEHADLETASLLAQR